MVTSLYAILTRRSNLSSASSVLCGIPTMTSRYLPEDVRAQEIRLSNGSKITVYHILSCVCDLCTTARTIISLNLLGPVKLAALPPSFVLSKTAAGSYGHGAPSAIQYSSPEKETSEMNIDPMEGLEGYYARGVDQSKLASVPASAHASYMANEANRRQVGGNHYKVIGIPEHWDLVQMYKWDYFQGQITKYLMRWRNKNGVEDLKKARHFLDKYIEIHEARQMQGASQDNSGSEPGRGYVDQDRGSCSVPRGPMASAP